MSHKPPRIYISAVERDDAGELGFDPQARDLLAKLAMAGYDVAWEKQWRDYKIIEREIAVCDALLAVVDMVWTSSTWMASEATWAMGQAGAMETPNQRMKPIPVLFYPVFAGASKYFRTYPDPPIILARNIGTALMQIKSILSLNP